MKKLFYKTLAVLTLIATAHCIFTFVAATPNPLEWTHFERFCYGLSVVALLYTSFVKGTKADKYVKL